MKRELTVLPFMLSLFLTACASFPPEKESPKAAEQITYKAVLDWYEKLRNPSISYHFDETSGRYTDAVVTRLNRKIPELRRDGEGSWYVELSPVTFMEEDFAYIEILTGGPFFHQKFVQVFRKNGPDWDIVDRLTLEGDAPAWIIEFDWDSYYKEIKNEREPNQAVDTTPASRSATGLRVSL